jgi:hypothetical protein
LAGLTKEKASSKLALIVLVLFKISIQLQKEIVSWKTDQAARAMIREIVLAQERSLLMKTNSEEHYRTM